MSDPYAHWPPNMLASYLAGKEASRAESEERARLAKKAAKRRHYEKHRERLLKDRRDKYEANPEKYKAAVTKSQEKTGMKPAYDAKYRAENQLSIVIQKTLQHIREREEHMDQQWDDLFPGEAAA